MYDILRVVNIYILIISCCVYVCLALDFDQGMTAMHRVSMTGNRKLELTLEDFGGSKIRIAKGGNFSPGNNNKRSHTFSFGFTNERF